MNGDLGPSTPITAANLTLLATLHTTSDLNTRITNWLSQVEVNEGNELSNPTTAGEPASTGEGADETRQAEDLEGGTEDLPDLAAGSRSFLLNDLTSEANESP